MKDMTLCPLTIALVAGEMSGDALGAGLIHSLKKRYPLARFVGVAGPKMKAEGCEAWFDMDELSVMGLIEVLGKLPRILWVRYKLTQKLFETKPDVFIGIDAPDFNLSLEGKLKEAGIKTVHYVSPSVWAWKRNRIHKIKKNTDLLLTFLPFEKAFYDDYNVPTRFIGHKMADDIPLIPDRLSARKKLNLPLEATSLAVLPGSRRSEVKLLTEPFLLAAKQLKESIPDLHIVVPLANAMRRKEFLEIKRHVAPDLELQLLDGHARDALIASNAALLASGTASLEAMLSKCPMVVAYKMKPFTFWLAKKLVKVPFVALPNILAGKALVPELLQDECYPDNLAQQLLPLLKNEHAQLKNDFLRLHQQIRCGADEQAAEAIAHLLEEKRR